MFSEDTGNETESIGRNMERLDTFKDTQSEVRSGSCDVTEWAIAIVKAVD